MASNLARAHTPRVHRDDLVIEAGEAPLVLCNQQRLKAALPVARHLQRHPAGVGHHALAAIAVPAVPGTAIARQVVLHLRVQRPLRQCLLHLVQQPATAKRRAGSRPGQQLVQDRVRYLWLFPSGHGETPSFPHDRSHTKFQTVPRTAASLRAYRQTAARRWRSRTTTSITDGATASGSCSTGSWTGAALSYHVVPKPSPGHHFRRHPHFKSFEPRRMASFSEAGYLIHGRPQPPGMLLFH